MIKRKVSTLGFVLLGCLSMAEPRASADKADQTWHCAAMPQSTFNFTIGGAGPCGGRIIFIDATGTHGLEAKEADEPEPVTWSEAVTLTQTGSGWRLPTSRELLLVYKHRQRIGGFSPEDYWSSTEQDVNSAWIQGFRMGDQDRYNKHSKLKVRLVREF